MLHRTARLHRHSPSLVPLMATIVGLALGLAINQSSGAIASARAEYDRPPLERRTMEPRGAAAPAQTSAQTSRGWRNTADAPAHHDHDHDHTDAAVPARRAASQPAAASRGQQPPAPAFPAIDPALPARGQSRAFAGVRDLTLSLPLGARAIGFHESGSSRALTMHPMGIPRVNANLNRLSSAPVGDGFEYLVLGSRQRRNGPTSAVDVSMPFNTPVHAPVTGTVVDATSYLLYREVPDNAVYIVPDARQDLVVVLMHLNGLKVNIGDRVEAGKTVLALTARQLPFGSQIDRYAGPLPHVHMELRPR